MRKIIIITAIGLIVLAAIIGVYLIWQAVVQKPVSEQPPGSVLQPEETSGQPIAPDEERPVLSEVVNKPIASYWVNAAGDEVFLVNHNGKIEKINDKKTITTVGERGMRNISAVTPTTNGIKALLQLTIFDPEKGIWTPLPEGATAAAWHPQKSDQLAYLTDNGLFLLDLTKNKSESVLRFLNYDWDLTWPETEAIYLSTKPSAAAAGAFWRLNLKTKNLQKIIDNEPSPLIAWAPDGRWGIKFNTGTIIDQSGKELFNLKNASFENFTTIPQKCALINEGIYCAVPIELPLIAETTIFDRWLKRILYTLDDFYFIRIDVEKKLAQARAVFISDEQTPIDAVNLTFRKNKIFFVNRYNQRLYVLTLPVAAGAENTGR